MWHHARVVPEDERAGARTNPALKAGRPAAQRGLDRVLGLNGVLARVLGEVRPPPRVARWLLRGKVGEGGMGVVFRAEDEETGAPVAVKLLERGTPELISRFRREARVLEALQHPGIVRYLTDGITEAGTPYLVMEWLEGRDARARLDAGPLRVEHALRLALAAARGLAGAHAAGVVHRDVKPSNLFLVGDSVDEVRLIDFGIARAAEADGRLTVTGQLVGTPSYMAPEQLEGRHVAASDVWGLGVTLFELVSGRLPFTAPSRESVYVAIAHAPAPRLASLCPEVTPALDALVARMLAKPLDARIGRMVDVATELADVLADVRVTPRAPGLSHGERAARPAMGGPPAVAPPASVVGRGRELGLLVGLVDASIEDAIAHVAFVRGDDGSGRTSMLDALERALGQRGPQLRVLRARAERSSRGAFAVLRELLTARTHALDFGAMLDALDRGLRLEHVADDAQVFTDLMRTTWTEVLDRWAATGPIAILLDDADAADLISLRFLARAAEHLRDHAFVFVATTRGDPVVDGSLRAMFTRPGQRAPVDVQLPPLEPKILARIAAALAPGAGPEEHARRAVLAGGSPGHVVELARALGDAREELPGTSAAPWGVRLERIEPEGRRILRAVSVVGRRVEPALLAVLLGQATVTPALLAELDRLVEQGVLRRTTTSAHELAFDFTREPARAACAAMLTDEDRVVGHGLAGEWLARRGGDPCEIARHFAAAQQGARAAPYFVRAARLALAGEDRAELDRLVDEGLAATESPELRGELHTLAAEGAYWAGDVAAAFERARRATEERPPGSAGWFRSASVAITAGGQLGRNDVVRALLARALAAPEGAPDDRDRAEARVVCIGRAITQLASMGVDVDDAKRVITQARAAVGVGPSARAWAARASVDARALHFDDAIEAWVQAYAAHLEARDQRGAAQVALYLGSYYAWSGAWARAREVIDDALHIARRLCAAYLETWAGYALGKVLVETAPTAVALDQLHAVIERAQDSPRIRAGAELYRALAALRGGDPERAERFAQAALAVPGSTALRAPATAAWVRALLSRGDRVEAEVHSSTLVEAARTRIVEFDPLVRLALVDLAVARGDAAAARATYRDARRALDEAAATLASPLRREELLRGPHLNAATLAYGEAWGA